MNSVQIRKYADRYWGIAYVCPRCEKKIAQELCGKGVICYLPTIPHAYMMHKTKVVTKVPMFPGYLFLCLGREEATDLRYEEKKIRYIDLQFKEERERILLEELSALQKCELLAAESPVFVNPGILAGDKVMITEGCLKGLETIVVRRDDDKNIIIVNITMLDQRIEYPVSVGDLMKITN